MPSLRLSPATTSTKENTMGTITRVTEAAGYLDLLANDIEKVVDATEKGTLTDACEIYINLKTGYDELDKARKRIYASLDKMNKQVIPTKLEASGVDKIQIPELARSFYISTKYSASMPDREVGYAWLRDNGYGDVIGETVNAGTLASLCKSMVLDDGVDVPADIIDFKSYNTTGSSKYTPKLKA